MAIQILMKKILIMMHNLALYGSGLNVTRDVTVVEGLYRFDESAFVVLQLSLSTNEDSFM